MHQRDGNAKNLAPYAEADNVHFFGHPGLLRLSCSFRPRSRPRIVVSMRRGPIALRSADGRTVHRVPPCFPEQTGPWLPAWSMTSSTSAPPKPPFQLIRKKNSVPARASFPLPLPRLAL